MIVRYDVEKVIVVRPNVPVVAAGDRLWDPSLGTISQGVGGFGVYIDFPGSGSPMAIDGYTDLTTVTYPTAAGCNLNTNDDSGQGNLPKPALANTYAPSTGCNLPLRVIQRRDKTAACCAPYERTWEESQYITPCRQFGIQIAGEPCKACCSSSFLLDQVNIMSGVTYKLQVSSHGARTDMFYSMYTTPTSVGTWTSPDWFSSSITDATDQLDFTMQNIVSNYNKNSQGFACAFAIASDGTAGAQGIALADIVAAGAGASYVLSYDACCKPRSITIDECMYNSIVKLNNKLINELGFPNAALVPSTLANCAGKLDSTGTALDVAGAGNTKADMVFVVAVDYGTACYDDMAATKRRITVALTDCGTSRKTCICPADEGQGKARNLRLLYESGEQYRQYSGTWKNGANHIAFCDEILDNECYDIYTITHCHDRVGSGGTPVFSPNQTIVALVNTERPVGTSPNSTATVNPQKTYFESVLNCLGAHYGLAGGILL